MKLFQIHAESSIGKDGMCKSRIQKDLNIDGISIANWNTESKPP